MDDVTASPQAIVTLAYVLAALFAVTGAFAWFRFIDRRSKQSGDGKAPDMHGLSTAATATALTMLCAGSGFLFSLFF